MKPEQKKVSSEQAWLIAQSCKFKQKGCPVCFYYGAEEPSVCCAFCLKYENCRNWICPKLKVKKEVADARD